MCRYSRRTYNEKRQVWACKCKFCSGRWRDPSPKGGNYDSGRKLVLWTIKEWIVNFIFLTNRQIHVKKGKILKTWVKNYSKKFKIIDWNFLFTNKTWNIFNWKCLFAHLYKLSSIINIFKINKIISLLRSYSTVLFLEGISKSKLRFNISMDSSHMSQ